MEYVGGVEVPFTDDSRGRHRTKVGDLQLDRTVTERPDLCSRLPRPVVGSAEDVCLYSTSVNPDSGVRDTRDGHLQLVYRTEFREG